jgi:hypothetical protein
LLLTPKINGLRLMSVSNDLWRFVFVPSPNGGEVSLQALIQSSIYQSPTDTEDGQFYVLGDPVMWSELCKHIHATLTIPMSSYGGTGQFAYITAVTEHVFPNQKVPDPALIIGLSPPMAFAERFDYQASL